MAVDSKVSATDTVVDAYDSESDKAKQPSSSKRKRKRTTSSGGESILANSNIKKPEKAKRKKKAKDVNAPQKPLNPYVMFLNKTRESVRVANPDSSFPEVTKLLAAQWTTMHEDEKRPYLEAAAKDRERYLEQVSVYRTTENYKKFQESKNQPASEEVTKAEKKSKNDSDKNAKKRKSKKKRERKRSFSPIPFDIKVKTSTRSRSNDADAKPTIESSNIPIFTEAFLEHNKFQESELRRLRKQTMDYEEANAILAKHIDTVSATETKLRDEIGQMKENNKLIMDHCSHLNRSLLTLFTNDAPTLLDDFILHHNNGSPLTLDNMDQLINFIYTKFTCEDSSNGGSGSSGSSSRSSEKEYSLLREKLKQLMEGLCKKDNDTCTEVTKSEN